MGFSVQIIAVPELAGLAAFLASRFSERGIEVSGDAAARIELSFDPALPADSCRIERSGAAVWRISGPELSAVVGGAGRFLHRSCFSRGAIWEAPAGTEIFTPYRKFRGIYLATHFHNFYHDAPLERVRDYLGDLALWGYNALMFWFDLHHFPGYDAPEAEIFRNRLLELACCAREFGMKIIANSVVNEAFADTPEALRAQNPERARRGGWYDSQVCPSAPGGMAYLRRQDERLLREFWGRINPEYFLYWPYDQGGCGCDRCHPWAENGFLQLYMRRREIARHFFPQAKFILSSWMFDSADYEFLRSALNENEVTCDMLLRENGGPAGMLSQVPEIGFPEISMNMLPWGAYGANPQPVRFQREWEERRGRIVGAVAYSEGIFEDINKILFAEFLSGDTPWRDALRLYAAYEFGEECTEPALELIARLEANHNLVPRPFLDYQERRKKPASVSSRVAASVAETLRLAEKIDACLPPWRRNNFRWRLIFLRSCLDQIYVESGGMPTPLADECCRELRRISYAENADNAVRPLLAGEYAGIEDLL